MEAFRHTLNDDPLTHRLLQNIEQVAGRFSLLAVDGPQVSDAGTVVSVSLTFARCRARYSYAFVLWDEPAAAEALGAVSVELLSKLQRDAKTIVRACADERPVALGTGQVPRPGVHSRRTR